MSPAAGIALMMNNYLHDVATALLAASAFALVVLLRRYEARPQGPEAARLFLEIAERMTTLARFSLAWIVLGGIPRTIWYGDFEWANAAGRGQVTALVVKHVVALVLVVLGIGFWRRLRRRVAVIRGEIGAVAAASAASGARG
jgi:hypothetical protein